ncbi:hypothetical protein PoB_000984800 [Plakobranchus ocellatus]|uniref:Uncharacterized protein n=1 Tax=Plakobranchus ocellatus TaxID=259542 RepID=A0AAV3YLE0_9GAST|nr:hypothetical protein PoB_000984800 [Plakobranchus ocellatus]
MVEEMSGVTHARSIKIRRGVVKILTSTIVLIFDNPKQPNRIRAEYLTLDIRPTKPADGGRSAPAAPPKGGGGAGNAQKEYLAQGRFQKWRPLRNLSVVLRPWPWKARIPFIFNLKGFIHPQLPEGLRLLYGVPSFLLQIPSLAHGGDITRSSVFITTSLFLHPQLLVMEVIKTI